MTGGVQLFSCPRCRRGEFRSLPGQDGKAFCPWCGDAVSTVGSAPSSLPFSTEPTSLVELAERMAAAAPDPGSEAGLRARLEDSERRREQAETELRREQDKKQEIKKAVQQELGRLEAELTETKARLRKKDEDHASALDDLARLKDAREKDWAAEWKGIQNSLETSERARRDLESQLREVQPALDAARKDAEGLKSTLGTAQIEKSDLHAKLAAAEARLREQKDRLQKAGAGHAKEVEELRAKTAHLESELGKRDQRIRELGMLVKTLGERLNDLADRRR